MRSPSPFFHRLLGTLVALTVFTVSALAETTAGWSADFDKSVADAKAANKLVLVEFTGSDWCPPCIMMHKKVFSQDKFIEQASKDFVLVELDFPKGDKELAQKNRPLAEKFKIEGFPTVVILDGEGKEITRFYASQYPSIEEFTKHLDKIKKRRKFD